jgi:hypothetical protein
MAKTPPERLAAALKANLKRRKQSPPSDHGPDPAKDPEKLKENPPHSPAGKRPGS